MVRGLSNPVVPGDLMFYCFFLALCGAISPIAATADRCENLTRDWKCVHLDNVRRKIGRLPRNSFLDNWFTDEISELPRPLP